MTVNLETWRAELDELDRQLTHFAANHHPTNPADAASPEDEHLSALKQQIDDRLSAYGGVGWQLLLLEWRYDFALLFDQMRMWMTYVDSGFKSETDGSPQPGGSALRP